MATEGNRPHVSESDEKIKDLLEVQIELENRLYKQDRRIWAVFSSYWKFNKGKLIRQDRIKAKSVRSPLIWVIVGVIIGGGGGVVLVASNWGDIINWYYQDQSLQVQKSSLLEDRRGNDNSLVDFRHEDLDAANDLIFEIKQTRQANDSSTYANLVYKSRMFVEGRTSNRIAYLEPCTQMKMDDIEYFMINHTNKGVGALLAYMLGDRGFRGETYNCLAEQDFTEAHVFKNVIDGQNRTVDWLNCSGSYFEGVTLRDIDFVELDANYCVFYDCKFENVTAILGRFERSIFIDTKFYDCNFYGANFNHVSISVNDTLPVSAVTDVGKMPDTCQINPMSERIVR